MSIKYEVKGVAAFITLDDPDRHNALTAENIATLRNMFSRAESDSAVRAAVLQHTGSTFCAGANLADAKKQGVGAVARDFIGLLRCIVELDKPVIARIAGNVRAGGMGIVGACDIALATRESTFALSEVRLGVAPAMITLTLLERMHPRAASAAMLTGGRFDAAEAADCGVLTAAVEDVDAALREKLRELARCAPGALGATKRLLNASLVREFDAQANDLAELSAELFAGEEAQAGMSAFFKKVPPPWCEVPE